jgi:hypothetical protein
MGEFTFVALIRVYQRHPRSNSICIRPRNPAYFVVAQGLAAENASCDKRLIEVQLLLFQQFPN